MLSSSSLVTLRVFIQSFYYATDCFGTSLLAKLHKLFYLPAFWGRIVSFVFQCVPKAYQWNRSHESRQGLENTHKKVACNCLPFLQCLTGLFAKSSRAFYDPFSCGIMSGPHNRASKLMPVADPSPLPWNARR